MQNLANPITHPIVLVQSFIMVKIFLTCSEMVNGFDLVLSSTFKFKPFSNSSDNTGIF